VVLPSYLFGTLGLDEFDVRSFCHDQPTEFAITMPPRFIAVAVLTLGIYTPHELELQCRAASGAAREQAPPAP
jgi:hypothetical protein